MTSIAVQLLSPKALMTSISLPRSRGVAPAQNELGGGQNEKI